MSHPDVVTTTTQQLPAWVNEGGQDLFNMAMDLIDQDYPIYEGPRIAGFSGDEIAGFDMVRDSQGVWQPFFDDARGSINSAGQAYGPIERLADIGPIDDVTAQTTTASMWDGDAWDTYGNPFYDKIVNDQIDEIRRNAAITQRQIGANAAAGGAWGGSRHGVMDAELGREMSTLINRSINEADWQAWEQAQRIFSTDADRKLRSDAGNQSALLTAAMSNQRTALERAMANQAAQKYNIDTSLGQWNTERDRDLSVGAGLADLGIMTSDFMTSDANNLLTIGGAIRDMDQQNLDLAYGDFLNEFYHPYENINFAAGVLSGVPYPRNTTQTTDGGGGGTGSTIAQIGGALATGYGIGKEFGWWG